jgi:hypothetical protein
LKAVLLTDFIANNPLTYTTSTGQQTTSSITNIYANTFASGSGYFNCGVSSQFRAYVVTYDNDGWGVQSSIAISQTSQPTLSYYTYSGTQGLYNAGQFTVNSGSYSGVLGSITSNDWYVQSIFVRARTATLSSSYAIAPASRYFTVWLNYPGSGYVLQFSGSRNPWNISGSASSEKSDTIDISDIGYGSSGFGQVNIRGVGTFTAATNIWVNTTVNGIVRTINYY